MSSVLCACMFTYGGRERERKRVYCHTRIVAMHCTYHVTHLHTHVQDGSTALWLACYNKHESAAAELMEATKLAGALDQQVGHEVWFGAFVVCGVRTEWAGAVVGAGRRSRREGEEQVGEERRGVKGGMWVWAQGTDMWVCVSLDRMTGSSDQRCTWPVKRAWRVRWRSSYRSARMPRLETR